jgi:hypothetical protein
VAIVQNGENVATEKPDELVLCLISALRGIAIPYCPKDSNGKKIYFFEGL